MIPRFTTDSRGCPIVLMALGFLLAIVPSGVQAESSVRSDTDPQGGVIVQPLVRTVDLNVGESRDVILHDGTSARIRVRDVSIERNSMLEAIAKVRIELEVNGEKGVINSGNYNLPDTLGDVLVDSPAIGAYHEESVEDRWALEKDVRLRLWPKGSWYIRPGTFHYPVNQRWWASATWYSNEPVAKRDDGSIYYHSGLDIGGAEGQTEVYSATDGLTCTTKSKPCSPLMTGGPWTGTPSFGRLIKRSTTRRYLRLLDPAI